VKPEDKATAPVVSDEAAAVEAAGAAMSESAELMRIMAQESAGWIAGVSSLLVTCFSSGNKILTCGNGGSASQADHAAAELAGKYYLKRRALPAISLVDNVANVTAVSNDLGYEQLFARQIEGLGQRGDVLLAFTTSGASANTTLAVKKAKEIGVVTVGFTGRRGVDFAALCDHCIVVPSEDTPRIQEVHLALAHNICALTEYALFKGR
jgi:D-sedoheptulose 7-phosphate isomerase